jgi:hypothetical protein
MPERNNDTQSEVVRLIEATIAGRTFKRAKGREVELLRFLGEHSNPTSATESLSEKTIGTEVFGLPKNWNPREPDAPALVRTTVTRLRHHLDDFFKYTPSGRQCARRIFLPDGSPYLLRVIDNNVQLDAVERFWDAHIISGGDCAIIYTEPLFFWDEDRRAYIRFLDINFESLDPDQIARGIRGEFGPDHPALKMKPCFHYQASGEIHACHKIQSWFEQNRVPIDVALSRDRNDDWALERNLIVLGNRRTNRLVRKLQAGLAYELLSEHIVIRDPDPNRNEQPEYKDLQPSGDGTEGNYVYAIVTRRPSLNRKRCATVIGANHGRAAEIVAHYLTSEKSLDSLYDLMGVQGTDRLPSQFQVLFRVGVVDFDTLLGEAEPIAHRVYPAVAKQRAGG